MICLYTYCHTKLTTREYLLFSDVVGVQQSCQVPSTEQKEVVLMCETPCHISLMPEFLKRLELLEIEIPTITKSKAYHFGSKSHKKLIADSVSSHLVLT